LRNPNRDWEPFSGNKKWSFKEPINTISTYWWSCKTWLKLDFSINYLADSIPLRFQNLTGLMMLQLFNKSLSGTIPKALGVNGPSQLKLLKPLENLFSGKIPGSIEKLVRIDWAKWELIFWWHTRLVRCPFKLTLYSAKLSTCHSYILLSSFLCLENCCALHSLVSVPTAQPWAKLYNIYIYICIYTQTMTHETS